MQLRLKTTYFTERQRRGILDTYIHAAKFLALPKEGLVQGRADGELGWTVVTPVADVDLDDLQDYGVLGSWTPLTTCVSCLDGLTDATTFATTDPLPPMVLVPPEAVPEAVIDAPTEGVDAPTEGVDAPSDPTSS